MKNIYVRATMLATAGFVATAALSPAMAAEKSRTITLPASAVKDETSRLCMPREMLGAKADRTMPNTICQTRSEWEAAGVVIKVK